MRSGAVLVGVEVVGTWFRVGYRGGEGKIS